MKIYKYECDECGFVWTTESEETICPECGSDLLYDLSGDEQ